MLLKTRFSRYSIVLACIAALSVSAQAQSVKGVSEKEIRIGTMTSLTGPLAHDGISLQAGTGAAVNAANDRGGINGRKIKLLGEDTAYSAPQALAVIRKMVSSEGSIFAGVGLHAGPQVGAVMPYMLEQQKIPIFGSFGGYKEFYYPPREGMFGTYTLGEDQALVLGRWVAKEGKKKVLTLHIDGSLYGNQAKEIERGGRSISKDGTFDVMAVKFGTTDYAPIAIKIAQAKPDALVTMLSEFETVLLAKELRNQRLDIQLYGWFPVVSQNLIATGGAAVEGMKAVSLTVSPLDDTPAVREYRDTLKKYFPAERPDFFSLYSFAVTKVFLEALSRMKGEPTPQELYKALYTMKNYDGGLLAPITYAPDRHNGTTSVFQAQIVNGKWRMGPAVDATNPNW